MRQHPRHSLQIAITWIFLGTLFTFLSFTSTHAAKPVRIGVSLGLTGRYAPLAAMQQRGFRLWESDINEKGGFFGRKVELIVTDDESNSKKAKELYNKFIANDRVDMVLAPYSSGLTAAVAPIVEKAGYPMLAAGAASDKLWQQGYKNLFGVFTSASRYTIGMLNLALIHDLTTVAIVHADDPFSVSVAEGARKWAPKLGLRVVMFEKFEKGTKDLSRLAKKARQTKPALLLVAGHFNESVNMRRALKKVNWYPKAYFATIGPVLRKYREVLSSDANLSFASSLWDSKLNFPESRDFNNRFQARFGMEPSYQAATAYAAGQILSQAINSAGTLALRRVRQALYKLQIHTIIGRYGVDKTGIQVKHFPLTVQWQKGKKEIVWPIELQTAKPIIK